MTKLCKNAVDLLFDALEQKDPDHFAVRQYKKYKLAAGKTAKSILISCGARLAPFDIREVREITMYDELELDMVGDRKTALFSSLSQIRTQPLTSLSVWRTHSCSIFFVSVQTISMEDGCRCMCVV